MAREIFEEGERFAVLNLKIDGQPPTCGKRFINLLNGEASFAYCTYSLMVESLRLPSASRRERLRVVRFRMAKNTKRHHVVLEVYPSPIAGKEPAEIEAMVKVARAGLVASGEYRR